MDKRNTIVNIVSEKRHRSMWKSNKVKSSMDARRAQHTVKYNMIRKMYIRKKPRVREKRCETPEWKS